MTYAAASHVAMYTPGLLRGETNFTATTRPTKAAVEWFLSAGYDVINGRVAAAGYTTPVPATATFYTEIVDLEALFGAARAEMAQLTAGVSRTERTRSQAFEETFNKRLDALLTQDLSRAGLTYTSKLYAGGISRADKTATDADTDRVQGRFARGQFRHAGTTRPDGSDTDETTD